MINSWILVSDPHGCFKTLMALLEKHGKGRQLILLGDLIDRGPRSRELVEYAMDNNIPTVMGNHESLALAYSKHAKMGYDAKCAKYYDHDVWLHNGGDSALVSWNGENWFGSTLPKNVLDWMAALPPYLIIETPNADGKKLLASHTGYGMSADKGDWITALWGRHGYDRGNFKNDGYYRAIGHTKRLSSHVTKTYAAIDTGCAYEGYGKLTGFLWPEMECVQVDNID